MWTLELHTYAHEQEHLHISHTNITNVSKFRKLICKRLDEMDEINRYCVK